MSDELSRGDEVIITGGIVQRVDHGACYDRTQNFGPRPGKGVLVSFGGRLDWFHPSLVTVVKAAPRRELKSGDRLIHKETGHEYVRVGGRWMLTFDWRGEQSEEADTWDALKIREHPDEFEYYPRSEDAWQ